VHSVLGPLQLERAYYHCSGCGHGFCPRDEHLGIEGTSLSPALTRMVGTVGAMVSFQEGSELLTELAGAAVDAKQVERTAEALGKEIAEDERVHTEALDSLALPQTLYLGMDGTGIPLRAEELAGRTGKRPDGSAKTGEVKLCTIWSAESQDEEGIPVRDEGSITYSAALESASAGDTAAERSAFAQRVWREATRRRFCQAPRRVVPVPTTHGLRNGRNAERKNSIPENSQHYSPPSGVRYLVQTRRAAASTISRLTASGCATRSFTPKACALPRAWWRPDARWPSVHALNAPGCTGLCKAPTPSSPFAARNSVVAFRTSGSAELNAGPHDSSLSWRAPYPSVSASGHTIARCAATDGGV
jgi:hypothetical protein